MKPIMTCGIKKIQYLFNEQDVLKNISRHMIQLEKVNTSQYRHDIEAYHD